MANILGVEDTVGAIMETTDGRNYTDGGTNMDIYCIGLEDVLYKCTETTAWQWYVVEIAGSDRNGVCWSHVYLIYMGIE